jgi:hypothetical protein
VRVLIAVVGLATPLVLRSWIGSGRSYEQGDNGYYDAEHETHADSTLGSAYHRHDDAHGGRRDEQRQGDEAEKLSEIPNASHGGDEGTNVDDHRTVERDREAEPAMRPAALLRRRGASSPTRSQT